MSQSLAAGILCHRSELCRQGLWGSMLPTFLALLAWDWLNMVEQALHYLHGSGWLNIGTIKDVGRLIVEHEASNSLSSIH